MKLSEIDFSSDNKYVRGEVVLFLNTNQRQLLR